MKATIIRIFQKIYTMLCQGAVDPLIRKLGVLVPQETMTMTMILTNWRRLNLAQVSEKKWKIVENELNLTLNHLVFCRLKDELLVNILVTISLKKSTLLIEILWGGGDKDKMRAVWQLQNSKYTYSL